MLALLRVTDRVQRQHSTRSRSPASTVMLLIKARIDGRYARGRTRGTTFVTALSRAPMGHMASADR